MLDLPEKFFPKIPTMPLRFAKSTLLSFSIIKKVVPLKLVKVPIHITSNLFGLLNLELYFAVQLKHSLQHLFTRLIVYEILTNKIFLYSFVPQVLYFEAGANLNSPAFAGGAIKKGNALWLKTNAWLLRQPCA